MIFETHTLQDPFKRLIESIFYFKGFQPDHSIERVVPTGHVFLIFELDGQTRNTFDNQTLIVNGSFNGAWLSGMHKNYLSISAHQDSEMLVVQFKPGGAYPFLHLEMSQFNDKVIPANQLFGDDVLSLREQLLLQEEASDKFSQVDQWLERKLQHSSLIPEELRKIVDQLYADSLDKHGKIVQSYSKTQKHLIHQFKKYIGLTPKVLHRVIRFNEVLQKIKAEEKLEWSQIAYQFEYADQSHFIKEFNEFSGFNPSEYINLDYHKEQPNFFPLDRNG